MTDNEIAAYIADYHLANLEAMRIAITGLLREVAEAGGKPFEGLPLAFATHLQAVAQHTQTSLDEARNRLIPMTGT